LAAEAAKYVSQLEPTFVKATEYNESFGKLMADLGATGIKLDVTNIEEVSKFIADAMSFSDKVFKSVSDVKAALEKEFPALILSDDTWVKLSAVVLKVQETAISEGSLTDMKTKMGEAFTDNKVTLDTSAFMLAFNKSVEEGLTIKKEEFLKGAAYNEVFPKSDDEKFMDTVRPTGGKQWLGSLKTPSFVSVELVDSTWAEVEKVLQKSLKLPDINALTVKVDKEVIKGMKEALSVVDPYMLFMEVINEMGAMLGEIPALKLDIDSVAGFADELVKTFNKKVSFTEIRNKAVVSDKNIGEYIKDNEVVQGNKRISGNKEEATTKLAIEQVRMNNNIISLLSEISAKLSAITENTGDTSKNTRTKKGVFSDR